MDMDGQFPLPLLFQDDLVQTLPSDLLVWNGEENLAHSLATTEGATPAI
jgi:hypothetical protein